jgi:hypothetical protein
VAGASGEEPQEVANTEKIVKARITFFMICIVFIFVIYIFLFDLF